MGVYVLNVPSIMMVVLRLARMKPPNNCNSATDMKW